MNRIGDGVRVREN